MIIRVAFRSVLKSPYKSLMARFFIVFIVILIVLFAAELTHPVQDAVVVPWTIFLAKMSASILIFLDGTVISYGKVLQHSVSGLGVSIEAGCNGIEAALILTAAVLAYPASWPLRLFGIVLGFVAIQAANVLRVITLFYLVEYSEPLFKFAHLYLWQVLIMLDVLIVWLLWVRQVARHEARVGLTREQAA